MHRCSPVENVGTLNVHSVSVILIQGCILESSRRSHTNNEPSSVPAKTNVALLGLKQQHITCKTVKTCRADIMIKINGVMSLKWVCEHGNLENTDYMCLQQKGNLFLKGSRIQDLQWAFPFQINHVICIYCHKAERYNSTVWERWVERSPNNIWTRCFTSIHSSTMKYSQK